MFSRNKVFKIINGERIQLNKLEDVPAGIRLDITGEQNEIIIGENCKFNNSIISVTNNKSRIIIGNQCTLIGLTISVNSGENQQLKIGDNSTFFGGMIVLRDYSIIEIGEDCLFAKGLTIWATDGHTIYDLTTEEVVNKTPEKLTTGKHCWIGLDVHILKKGTLPDETVVGVGSVVTKEFTESHTVIGGYPARILRKNIGWNRHTIVNWEKLKDRIK